MESKVKKSPLLPFDGFSLRNFWENSKYVGKDFHCSSCLQRDIDFIEAELKITLPASYLFLLKLHNGGIPKNRAHPTVEPTSWAENHVAIMGILGLGSEPRDTLLGERGFKYYFDTIGYPRIGLPIATCPNCEEEMIFLDYRCLSECGEPIVVILDLEGNTTFLARNFESFIKALVPESVYECETGERGLELEKCQNGQFSKTLRDLCDYFTQNIQPPLLFPIEKWIRFLAIQIVNEKSHFALHYDKASMRLYDIQFWLYHTKHARNTREQYMADYPDLIALAGAAFSCGAFGSGFVQDWLTDRMRSEDITMRSDNRLVMQTKFRDRLLNECRNDWQDMLSGM